MKKLIALLLALIMLLSLAACSKKPVENDNDFPDEPTQDAPTQEQIEGDPAEYSMEYWAEQYPGQNICPFYIEENGVEKPYYLVMELSDNMDEWIETPFNWNGWHKLGNDIVNKDETLKMTDDWVGEDCASGFSSFCTVTTEPLGSSADSGFDTSYNFEGYTETANWPDADTWADFGLPELPMSDDVNGSVRVSTKDWISRLDGEDGFLFEAAPASSQIDSIVSALLDAGIDLYEDEGFDLGYTGYYTHNGNEMKITVAEYNGNSIYLLIVINPDY